MADVLFAITPYTVETRKGPAQRAKVDFEVLEKAKIKIRDMSQKAGSDIDYSKSGYPHFYYLDDKPGTKADFAAMDLMGEHVDYFVNYGFSSDVEALKIGQSQTTSLKTPVKLVEGISSRMDKDQFRFTCKSADFGLSATFLRALSDGYIVV